MGSYLPSTKAQQMEMLKALGLTSMNELYADIPEILRKQDQIEIPPGKSELEVRREMSGLAEENTVFQTSFRGAGAYRHYIPAIVDHVVSKESFLTAYTPYQAEISQGVLQSIFEYQTMICQLTGMDVSNASLYDGATAAAEAVAMCRDQKRNKVLVSASAHPEVIETIQTYCWAAGTSVTLIPCRDGATDLEALADMLDDTIACVYVHQPSFYGRLEDCETVGKLTHGVKAKFIMGINPIAAAILKTPGECGADIAVGEGQPLGMHLSFGGPYLGFMAATTAMMRKLPGRIAGETTDADGNRAFVLTLQAREQHIRREKAGSNVCSNQALCAMTAAVYLAAMGPQGLKSAAIQSMSKAHYLAAELEKIGFTLKYNGDFFHEFVTTCSLDPKSLEKSLCSAGILCGLPVDNGILWCATEMNTKTEIDKMIRLIQTNADRKEA